MNALLVASRSSEPHKGGWSPVGRLEFDQGTYRFVYTRGAKTATGFTPFSGMEKLEDIYESAELFPVCCRNPARNMKLSSNGVGSILRTRPTRWPFWG